MYTAVSSGTGAPSGQMQGMWSACLQGMWSVCLGAKTMFQASPATQASYHHVVTPLHLGSFHSKTSKRSHTSLLGLAFHSLKDLACTGILFAYFATIVTGLAA